MAPRRRISRSAAQDRTRRRNRAHNSRPAHSNDQILRAVRLISWMLECQSVSRTIEYPCAATARGAKVLQEP